MFKSIIIEGPDGCGKSKLAAFLSYELDIPIYTAGPKPKNFFQQVYQLIEQYGALNNGYILDRCTPFSQAVYRDIPNNLIYRILQKLFIRKSCLIYCITKDPIHEIKHYDTADHIEYLNKQQSKISSNYESIMDQYPHTVYDWRVDDEFKLLKSLFRPI